MIKVENNPFFREETPKVKFTFTVKEVNDLISTIAQYVAGDMKGEEWFNKMLVHCGHNAEVFNHAMHVIPDSVTILLKRLLNK